MATEFDEQLKQRLLAFQQHHGLVADGVAGTQTWSKLAAAGAGATTDTDIQTAAGSAGQQTGHEQAGYPDAANAQAETDSERASGSFGGACDSTTPLPIHNTLRVAPKTTMEIGFRSSAGSVNVDASSRYTAPLP